MHDIKTIILAGGLGMRLRSVVPSKPKVLASIGERSFLELLVQQLRGQGIRQLVMCTGYLADQIETRLGDGTRWNVSIEYSKEETPLGTAGALKLAQRYVGNIPDFLVLNGDSFLEINFQDLIGSHREHSRAVATMAVVRVEDAGRYGTVNVDSSDRVIGFAEKTGSNAPGLVNGGVSVIAKVSELLIDAFRGKKKVILFGNGGSAADAQHIAAEFVGRFALDRAALPALALSVNTSCITAIGNDYGFDLVFARQIEALGQAGDVAIGISTSGNSPNVIQAVSLAKKMGLHTIALCGNGGGKLKNAVDHCICVPSNETPRIQECHILIGHIISELVEQSLYHEQQSCVSRS